MHSTIISVGSPVSNFAGNLRAQKLKKAQTKKANTTGVHYNSWWSIGSGVNFVLSFLLLYICDNSHLFSLSIEAASRRCCGGLPLTYCVWCVVQYTASTSAIPHLIRWAGRFFVVRSLKWYWYWEIVATIVVPLSRTPLNFPFPIRLWLSSCVSSTVVPSSSRFSSFVLILHSVHHKVSLLLSLLCCLFSTYPVLSQPPANHRASRYASIVAPRRLQQIPPPPNFAIATTPPTPVSNILPIHIIKNVSAVTITILPTAVPEQQHSLFHKISAHIEAKSPCWTFPLSLCSVPSDLPRPCLYCYRIGCLLPGRTQRHRPAPEIRRAWGPTTIPMSRPSTTPTHNPPSTSSCGPNETPSTGTTVARFLITPPPSYPSPPPSLYDISIFILLCPALLLLLHAANDALGRPPPPHHYPEMTILFSLHPHNLSPLTLSLLYITSYIFISGVPVVPHLHFHACPPPHPPVFLVFHLHLSAYLPPPLSSSSSVSSAVLTTQFSIIPTLFSNIFLRFSFVPLCSPHSMLLAPIYFACFKMIYAYHSGLLFSIRATLISSLCSNIIDVLLYTSFSPFFFDPLQLALLVPLSSIWSALTTPSPLCSSDCSTRAPL